MKTTKLFKLFILAFAGIFLFLTGISQDKVVRIFKEGQILQEYLIDNIDYIEIDDYVGAPSDIEATVSGKSITISWDVVAGATYSIYRSPDNSNFTLLATDIKENKYTDNSPLKGSNFYRVKAQIGGKESNYTASVAATPTETGLESGVYLGVIGFNYDLYRYPITLLDDNNVSTLNSFIDDLAIDDQTVLYYSVEEALRTLQSTEFPSDISEVALVTFTDGIDRGSHRMNDSYWDEADGDLAYRNDLSQKIKMQTVAGKNLSAYCIGLKGDDVKTTQQEAVFKDNLQKLSSATSNAFEVNNMTEVNSRFRLIAEELNKRTNIQTVKLRIPPAANGAKIRFTFDNQRLNADYSRVYIEATFNIRTNSLENISYHGLTSTTGSSTMGEVDAKGNITFTFNDIITDNGMLIVESATHEHIYHISGGFWDPNSEYGKEGDTHVRVDKSSVGIMLVLDCTTSLGDEKFAQMKASAKSFIKTLVDAVNDPTPTPTPDPTPDPIPDPTPDPGPFTEYIYIVGSGIVNGTSLIWDPTSALKLGGRDGFYQFTIVGAEGFKISTTGGDTWELFNAGCLGVYNMKSGVNTLMPGSDDTIFLPWKGDWDITIDLTSNILTASSLTSADPSAEYPKLYLRGGMNNWEANPDWEMTPIVEGNVYKFVCPAGVAIDTDVQFKFANADWQRVSMGSDGESIILDTVTKSFNGGNPSNITLSEKWYGAVYIILDLNGSSYMFFTNDKSESAAPEWARI